MKIIARSRGTGKTSELLKEANINNGQVLVANKRAIQVKAESYGLQNLSIIDWNDLMYGHYEKEKPLYIDNAELFLARLFKDDFELTLQGIDFNLEE